MIKKLFLLSFQIVGSRLVQSVCLYIMLFTLLRMANDQTRLGKSVGQLQTCFKRSRTLLAMLALNAEHRQSAEQLEKKLFSALNNNSVELHRVNISNNNLTASSDLRDKYSKWIPHPHQEITSLSDKPYAIKNSYFCLEANSLDIIVLVHSAAGNFKRRQGIRNTWGNIKRLRQKSMKIIFLLGLTESSQVQKNIYKENGKYSDIVQGNFIDTYHNLTHKAVLGLRWVTEFCNKSRTVMKIDDDVFIDTVKLFTESDKMFKDKPNSIYCLRNQKHTIPIQRTLKWKVAEDEFRNQTLFPLSYCGGFFVVMPTNIAIELYRSAYSVPFFWIDDFYVYGMLTDKVGVNSNVIDVGHLLSLDTQGSLNCFGMTEKKCNLLVGSAPSQEFMQSMWEKMLYQNKDRTRYVFNE